MGRKSTKSDKNVFQTAREGLGLTREAAAEKLQFISDDKIEKIESGKASARPEEVLAMADAYDAPELCNYYCAHECPIGQKYVPEIKEKNLAQITVEMIASINALNKEKERLIEIAVDGKITDDEKADFEEIRSRLSEMAAAIDSLSLWVDKALQ